MPRSIGLYHATPEAEANLLPTLHAAREAAIQGTHTQRKFLRCNQNNKCKQATPSVKTAGHDRAIFPCLTYPASLKLCAVCRSTDTSCEIPRSAIVTPNNLSMCVIVMG